MRELNFDSKREHIRALHPTKNVVVTTDNHGAIYVYDLDHHKKRTVTQPQKNDPLQYTAFECGLNNEIFFITNQNELEELNYKVTQFNNEVDYRTLKIKTHINAFGHLLTEDEWNLIQSIEEQHKDFTYSARLSNVKKFDFSYSENFPNYFILHLGYNRYQEQPRLMHHLLYDRITKRCVYINTTGPRYCEYLKWDEPVRPSLRIKPLIYNADFFKEKKFYFLNVTEPESHEMLLTFFAKQWLEQKNQNIWQGNAILGYLNNVFPKNEQGKRPTALYKLLWQTKGTVEKDKYLFKHLHEKIQELERKKNDI